MFRLLAQEVPAAQLHEVRRFDAPWEREASIRLRDGDLAAVAAYDRHGRIRGADEKPPTTAPRRCGWPTTCAARTCCCWPGPTPKLQNYPAASRPGSPRWARSALRRPRWPTATRPASATWSGPASTPRSTRAAAQLTNRDTLKVTAFRGPEAEVRRQRPDGTWTEPFRVPRSYLAHSAELAYAGNVHVAQGRTVDTAHLLVTESLSRQALYVGMTRGRQANTAHVVTGKTAPPGHQPYQQASPRIRARTSSCSARPTTCPPPSRSARPRNGPAEPATCSPCGPPPPGRPCTRTLTSRSRPGSPNPRPGGTSGNTPATALQQQLRAAQFAGHDIGALIDQITAAPLDGARSISSVLHGRLQQLGLHGPGHDDATWSQRTPQHAPAGRARASRWARRGGSANSASG